MLPLCQSKSSEVCLDLSLLTLSSSPTLHPFVAILSHAKGKKAIPRVFRHLDDKQRITLITVIAVQLDSLDVVHNALTTPIPATVKEDIELFLTALLPIIIGLINDSPSHVVVGLLGLILDRTDIRTVTRTKVGLSIITVLVSRAEYLHGDSQASADKQLWDQYDTIYLNLFAQVEPLLHHLFPEGNPASGDDVYVWQFLAAMGVGASARPEEPELAQRLVLGVKERVNDAVGAAKTLPTGEKERRLGEVNLFMVSLGLDVELLVR
jgi:DNA topoisomerase 2-associated protein PAT1